MDKNPNDQNENRKKLLNAFARYSGMASQIAAAVILGLFAGKWLDKHFNNSRPILTALLSILGLFIGLFIVFRDIFKK